MAYKSYVLNHPSEVLDLTDQNVFDAICYAITQMGWELHDDISSTEKIYRSPGEDGVKPYCYVRIFISIANSIKIIPYLYWNNTTHAGVLPPYIRYSEANRCCLIYSNTKTPIYIAGDKDAVYIDFASDSIGSYCQVGKILFGHIRKKRGNDCKMVTTSGITAGSNVVVNVDDSSACIVGESYAIIGETEGREWNVAVNAVNSPTQIVLNSVAENYAAGAAIGDFPLLSGATALENPEKFTLVCPRGFNGTNQPVAVSSGASLGLDIYPPIEYQDPSGQYKNYGLSDLFFYEVDVSADPGHIGYDNTYLFMSPGTRGDLFCKRDAENISGVVSSSTASVLTDSTKAWTTNALAGKYLVIVDGVGAYQSRKIASNTGTTITVSLAFDEAPAVSSIYYVVNEVYRKGLWLTFLETVDSAVVY